MNAYECVDALLSYAADNLLLDELDEVYTRNKLFSFLGLAPKETVLTPEAEAAAECEYPDSILDALTNALKVEGEEAALIKDGVTDIISLSPHEITDQFEKQYTMSPKKATDFLYDYCVKNYYVKKSLLNANPKGEEKRKGGDIRYTINLTRPEFGGAGDQTYPKCNICLENEGCAKKLRRNLRTIPLTLADEDWFWQYSPYGYFNEHGIAVSVEHKPMTVNEKTIERLFDFVDMFPHYFIGSNAALPGVGGSVLSHDHYQGGGEKLPMQNAPSAMNVISTDELTVDVIDWYAAAVRIQSKSRAKVAEAFTKISNAWSAYSNADYNIVASDDDGQHNALAPIMRKDGETYVLDVVFKNNRTDEAHPLGIFHVPAKYLCIKKEAIGLIEAQGLFVLPGRLKDQLAALETALAKNKVDGELKDFAEFAAEIKDPAKDTKAKIESHLMDALAAILEATSPFPTKDATKAFTAAALEL